MTLLFVFFFISILFSFLCSVWEAVLFSTTPSFVNQQVEKGASFGKKLQSYKAKMEEPISAILTLNTVAHTVGAIGVGAQATIVFKDSPALFSFLGYSLTAETIVAVIMTLAILILSEIIPKTIGATYWRSLAGFTVKALTIIIFLFKPLIAMGSFITKGLKSKDAENVLAKRAEFLANTRLGKKEGVLKENESAIIENLLHLNKLKAKDIMTPRTMMFMANDQITLKAFYDANPKAPFSRIPIFGKNRDNITGFVLKNEILTGMLDKRENAPLNSLKRDLAIVNDNKELPHLFEFLSKNRSHIAAVSDEYGSIIGLVTLEDLFETILGFEIMDETDNIPDLQQYARKKWEERANKMGLIKQQDKE